MGIDRGQIRDNFVAYLSRDDGIVVPGSVRRGHNIITRAGRMWLSKLVAWAAISASVDDTPVDSSRIRWFSVGSGEQVVEPGITQLDVPEPITTGPDVYLKLASVAPAYPDASRVVRTAVRFSCQFAKAELPDPMDVSEAAIFADFNDTLGRYGVSGSSMPDTTQYAEPVAYKVIYPPLQKTSTYNLNLRWELRF